MRKPAASLAPRFIASLIVIVTLVSILLSGAGVLYERRMLLLSLRSRALAVSDYTASALGYPVWNVVYREIDVLLLGAFRDESVYGAVLELDDVEPRRIAFTRGAGSSIKRGEPDADIHGFVERREVMFESRKVGTLELHFTDRLVDERMRSESIFIAVVVLLLDWVLGLFLLLVLRSTVFRPLARIERWAAALERGEEPPSLWDAVRERGEIASLRTSIERMVGIILTKEREYRSLFNDSPASIWELDFSRIKDEYSADPDSFDAKRAFGLLSVTSVNPVTLDWLGVRSLGELSGKAGSLLGEDALAILSAELRALAAGAHGAAGECRLLMPSGTVKHFAVRFATIAGHETDWARVLMTGADITDRARAEERLVSALTEKDLLLQELFHRTRNSLQLISSMIALREPYAASCAQTDLRAIRGRIDTIALAQDKLYESENLSVLDLGNYLSGLTEMIVHGQDLSEGRIRLDIKVEAVPVSIDHAVPLGLLLCELVSNALAHAFPEGRGGTLSVTLLRPGDGGLELSVRDDGVGPPPGFDPRRDAGYGLETAIALGERQLRGKLAFSSESGFSAVLRFRLPEVSSRIP